MAKLLLVLSVALTGSILYIFSGAIAEDMAQYRAEGECVAKYISQGIERRDIAAGNGTCYIK